MIYRNSLVGMVVSILLMGCSLSTPADSKTETVSEPSLPAVTSPVPVQTSQGQQLPISAKTNIAGKPIDLEVARTPQQQATGLMYRTSLADDRGMLFPFDPPQPVRFWMKNVAIDLDMIFLRDGEVKAIEANVPPCTTLPCSTYGPSDTLVDQVIELRGGRASELGIKVGDRIAIQFLGTNTEQTPQFRPKSL